MLKLPYPGIRQVFKHIGEQVCGSTSGASFNGGGGGADLGAWPFMLREPTQDLPGQ